MCARLSSHVSPAPNTHTCHHLFFAVGPANLAWWAASGPASRPPCGPPSSCSLTQRAPGPLPGGPCLGLRLQLHMRPPSRTSGEGVRGSKFGHVLIPILLQCSTARSHATGGRVVPCQTTSGSPACLPCSWEPNRPRIFTLPRNSSTNIWESRLGTKFPEPRYVAISRLGPLPHTIPLVTHPTCENGPKLTRAPFPEYLWHPHSETQQVGY